jgi:ribosomal protein L35
MMVGILRRLCGERISSFAHRIVNVDRRNLTIDSIRQNCSMLQPSSLWWLHQRKTITSFPSVGTTKQFSSYQLRPMNGSFNINDFSRLSMGRLPWQGLLGLKKQEQQHLVLLPQQQLQVQQQQIRQKHTIKTNSSVAKRFRVRGDGKTLIRSKSGKQHNTGYKTRSRCNQLGKSTTIKSKIMERKMRRCIGAS